MLNSFSIDRDRFCTSRTVAAIVGLTIVSWADAACSEDPARPAIQRAVAFLTREVPEWHAANNCYSCHNNADAVRALVAARRRGFDVPDSALVDSTHWLHRVEDWRRNGGEGEFNDYELAAIQFASALVTVTAADGSAPERSEAALGAIRSAARRVANFQRRDGSWMTGPGSSIGSPATYGPVLATVTAAGVLHVAADPALQASLDRTHRWLNQFEPRTVFDAAAILHGRSQSGHQLSDDQLAASLRLLRNGRHSDGGWGPYVHSMSEPFDTALVLLALIQLPRDQQPEGWISAGRSHLLSTQYDDGSWPETTRPAGRESYAQRVSTTAWATMALLATSAAPSPGEPRSSQRLERCQDSSCDSIAAPAG